MGKAFSAHFAYVTKTYHRQYNKDNNTNPHLSDPTPTIVEQVNFWPLEGMADILDKSRDLQDESLLQYSNEKSG